jgi:hypothetical protein
MSVVMPNDDASRSAGPSPAPRVTVKRKGPVWVKLWSITILANLAGFVMAIYVAKVIRSIPDSATTETLLRLAYYGAMLLVAFVDALLVDELLLGGAFRKTHLQGVDARHLDRAGADVSEVAVSLQRSNFTFPVLIIACGGLTYLGFNAVNHDFDTYWRRIGVHVSALHHGEPEARKEAVAALSIRRDRPVLPNLVWALAEGDSETAAWAAWALGRHRDLPRRRALFPPLVEATRGGDPLVRREALVALGRLQHRAMAEAIHEEIALQLDAEGTVDPRLLYALGSIQVMSSVPLLERLLHEADEPTQRMAAWALAQHRDQVGGREVVTMLEQRLPTASPLLACALVHALGILADERSNLALTEAYDRASPQQRAETCPMIRLNMRPDREDDAEDLLVPQDTFANKILLSMGGMRATTPEVRGVVEPWLVALISDPTTEGVVREPARNLLSGIRAARDDSASSTVEAALGIEED